MAQPDRKPYTTRLFARVWQETLAVWNPHRWWFYAAPAVWSGIVYLYRHGLAIVTSAGDVAINVLGGCAVAFAGSWLLNLVRSFKLLDDDRAVEIEIAEAAHERANGQVAELRAENADLKRPKRPAHEQAIFEEIAAEVRSLQPHERRYLEALRSHLEVDADKLRHELIAAGMPENEWLKAVTHFRTSNTRIVEEILPSPSRPRNYVRINPLYRDYALEALHNTRPPST